MGTMTEVTDQVDPKELTHQLEACGQDLWCYLRHSVRNQADAEDLYQEVHLKAWKNLSRVEKPERFRSWLFSIAMNSVRSFFRKRKPISLDEQEGESSIERLVSNQPSPQTLVEKQEHLAQLREAISRLEPRYREVLLLDVMAEMPQKDIAAQLDLNLNTVKTITRRAKIKLARIMAEVANG